jgi:hypothetical protein
MDTVIYNMGKASSNFSFSAVLPHVDMPTAAHDHTSTSSTDRWTVLFEAAHSRDGVLLHKMQPMLQNWVSCSLPQGGTVLTRAVREGLGEVCQYLLCPGGLWPAGWAVQMHRQRDEFRHSVLHLAVLADRADILIIIFEAEKRQLKLYRDCVCGEEDQDYGSIEPTHLMEVQCQAGDYAIALAVQLQRVDCLKVMLSPPYWRTKYLHSSCLGLVSSMAHHGSVEMLEVMIMNNVDLHSDIVKWAREFLRTATKVDDVAAVARIFSLLKRWIPRHMILRRTSTAFVDLTLVEYYDVRVKHRRMTEEAVESGGDQVLRYLLDHCSCPVINQSSSMALENAIELAIFQNNTSAVGTLLTHTATPLSCRDEVHGYRYVKSAITYNHHHMIRLLLQLFPFLCTLTGTQERMSLLAVAMDKGNINVCLCVLSHACTGSSCTTKMHDRMVHRTICGRQGADLVYRITTGPGYDMTRPTKNGNPAAIMGGLDDSEEDRETHSQILFKLLSKYGNARPMTASVMYTYRVNPAPMHQLARRIISWFAFDNMTGDPNRLSVCLQENQRQCIEDRAEAHKKQGVDAMQIAESVPTLSPKAANLISAYCAETAVQFLRRQSMQVASFNYTP